MRPRLYISQYKITLEILGNLIQKSCICIKTTFGMLILQYTNMIYCFIVKNSSQKKNFQCYSCKNGKFVNFHFKRDFLHFDILRIFKTKNTISQEIRIQLSWFFDTRCLRVFFRGWSNGFLISWKFDPWEFLARGPSGPKNLFFVFLLIKPFLLKISKNYWTIPCRLSTGNLCKKI